MQVTSQNTNERDIRKEIAYTIPCKGHPCSKSNNIGEK